MAGDRGRGGAGAVCFGRGVKFLDAVVHEKHVSLIAAFVLDGGVQSIGLTVNDGDAVQLFGERFEGDTDSLCLAVLGADVQARDDAEAGLGVEHRLHAGVGVGLVVDRADEVRVLRRCDRAFGDTHDDNQ